MNYKQLDLHNLDDIKDLITLLSVFQTENKALLCSIDSILTKIDARLETLFSKCVDSEEDK